MYNKVLGLNSTSLFSGDRSRIWAYVGHMQLFWVSDAQPLNGLAKNLETQKVTALGIFGDVIKPWLCSKFAQTLFRWPLKELGVCGTYATFLNRLLLNSKCVSARKFFENQFEENIVNFGEYWGLYLIKCPDSTSLFSGDRSRNWAYVGHMQLF